MVKDAVESSVVCEAPSVATQLRLNSDHPAVVWAAVMSLVPIRAYEPRGVKGISAPHRM